jgi:hypothetical protein
MRHVKLGNIGASRLNLSPPWASLSGKMPREGRMLDGISVLAVGLAIMVAIWLVVLWGSRYLGPR